MEIIYPDHASRPFSLHCHHTFAFPVSDVFEMWVTDKLESWFAAPGTMHMELEPGRPFFFETRFDGQRHPHYGRLLVVETNRKIEMTWLTEMGTQGAETLLVLEFEQSDTGCSLSLTHSGFPDQKLCDGHADAWPGALQHLDNCMQKSADI